MPRTRFARVGARAGVTTGAGQFPSDPASTCAGYVGPTGPPWWSVAGFFAGLVAVVAPIERVSAGQRDSTPATRQGPLAAVGGSPDATVVASQLGSSLDGSQLAAALDAMPGSRHG